MRRNVGKSVLAVIGAGALSLAMWGCGGESSSEHPSSEHPEAEKTEAEHPSEHPEGESHGSGSKAEHPEHPE